MDCYRIAVVMTCFNRKDMTLNCIKTLTTEKNDYLIDYYVCDDASTDGTPDAIEEVFPFVNLIRGTGSLFWCRGMYLAMQTSINGDYDFYIMVNDDVVFFNGTIEGLVKTYLKAGKNCGVVGYTISQTTGSVTYGGVQGDYVKILGKKCGIKNECVVTSNEDNLVKCLMANWNCFLIDRMTINEVGLIDKKYEHGIGDYDYALMMTERGIPIYSTENPVGFCERNPVENTFRDAKLNRRIRIRKMLSRKGFPIKSRFYYQWKHWGIVGVMYAMKFYLYYLGKIVLGEDIR